MRIAKIEDQHKALVGFLNELFDSWLSKHIMGTDKAFGPFLNAKGVK
jgi:hemerythrin